MSSPVEPPNYWPGFVDALVTVLLNLLFLVGIFAVGLVSLNMEVMGVQNKLAELEAQALSAQKNGMVLVTKGTTIRQTAPQPTQVSVKVGPRIQELRIQTALAESVPTSMTSTMRTPSAVQAYIEQLTGGQFLARLDFEPQYFVWPPERALPVLDPSALSRGWVFVTLTDKNNPRLLREAFKRLGSVRAEYLRMGTAPEKLQIQIEALPADLGTSTGLENTVWVLGRPP